MTYKEAVLAIMNEWNKTFFSKHRSADVEEAASMLFEKFEKQVKEQDENKVVLMLLKVMVTEGVLIHGQREQEDPAVDA